jgi:chromosome segregation ATPase
MVSIRAKADDGHLDDAIQELEKIFVDRIGGLKAAFSDNQAVVASKTQHAEQVIEGLKANITALEAKLRETEDALHKKDVANQKMEESLNTKIRDLQSVVTQKEEALESRDSEVNGLKSNREVLAEQITRLELAIQQAKGEAASKAQHAEQVIEGLKANITALEAKLKETEDALHKKDVANQKMEESLNTKIRDLQSVVTQKEEALESRDSEVNGLKSNREVLAEQITRLELVIQQAKGEAASKAQHAEQVIEGLKAKIATLQPQLTQAEQIVVGTDCTMTGLGKDRHTQVISLNAELKSQTNGIKKVAGATSVVTEAARKTVSQDAFAHMTAEFSKLTNIMGSIASLIVRDHVRGLGESMEEFPQTRLTDLLDSLSGQITDDKLKADFRKRFGKV